MTNRERLLATFRFQPTDRVPDLEFGAWEQTYERWKQEGMQVSASDYWDGINAAFPTDSKEVLLWAGNNLIPTFERKVLEEKDDHLIIQDEDGAISEMVRPELGASIPRYLRYAIETKEDWEKIRDEKLNPDTPERYGSDEELDNFCKQSLTSEVPVQIWCGSVYGYLRNWMGVENISIAIMEQPEWIVEMMTHCMDLNIKFIEKIAGKCRIDYGNWWEDMCYNKGPLVSPRWFAENMVPLYKRVTDLLRNECGCEFHQLDCDGNIHSLVPLWLEGGINVMFPLEAAHSDGYKIRADFGTKVPIRGYYDKHALIAGKEAIDKEFERLRPLLQCGGFIPHTDHLVPPDVSWENYCYYREKKMEFIGKG